MVTFHPVHRLLLESGCGDNPAFGVARVRDPLLSSNGKIGNDRRKERFVDISTDAEQKQE